jgi:predicted RNase H-like nuclease (RuvC/YqgF family)
MRRASPKNTFIVVSAALIAGALVQPAAAQTARAGGGQNAQLMQQLQQLASERTTMQAEQAKLKKELEDVKKERDALKAAQTGAAANQRARAESEAAVARANRDKESVEGELTRTKARTEEIVTKFRETVATLREVETDRTTAKQAVVRQEQELKACTAANDGLYKLNDEVLTHFSDQGFWSGLARAEPFTKLKRVQLDNLIDGYRTRAQDAQYVPGMTPPVAPPATTSR